jgi:hypothetical protein
MPGECPDVVVEVWAAARPRPPTSPTTITAATLARRIADRRTQWCWDRKDPSGLISESGMPHSHRLQALDRRD